MFWVKKVNKKSKNILLIHRYFWPDNSSCSSIIKDISTNLISDGNNVDVISSQPSYRQNFKNTFRINPENIDGVNITRLNLPNETGSMFIRIKNSIKLGLYLIFRSLTKNYDLIIVTSIPPILGGFFGMIASKIKRIKLIYFCMDIHPEIGLLSKDYKKNIFYRFLLKIDILNCKFADTIIVHSKDMRDSILSRNKKNQYNIKIINNFSKSFRINKNQNLHNYKKKNSLKIIYTGNLGRFQSLQTIFKTMELIKENKLIELILVGEGSEKIFLKDMAKKTKINVKFIDYLSEPAAQLKINEADIGLVSLMKDVYKYAYPSKTMSYLEQGKPIIAMIETSSQLSIDMKKNGYGFSIIQDDHVAFANLLTKLSKSNLWRDRMSKNAIKAYKQYYTSDVILKSWSNVVNQTLK